MRYKTLVEQARVREPCVYLWMCYDEILNPRRRMNTARRDLNDSAAVPHLFTSTELRGKRSTYINQTDALAEFSHGLYAGGLH